MKLLLIPCRQCNKKLPPGAFRKRKDKYANRFGCNYICKDCEREYQKELFHKKKFQIALEYWDFHDRQTLYDDLAVPGFGGFDDGVTLATYYFLIPLDWREYNMYVRAFNTIFSSSMAPSSVIGNVHRLRNVYRDVPLMMIYLKCSSCKEFRRTYEEAPLSIIPEKKTPTPLYFNRNYQTKTGWDKKCRDCSK